jgi:hypothetical protein
MTVMVVAAVGFFFMLSTLILLDKLNFYNPESVIATACYNSIFDISLSVWLGFFIACNEVYWGPYEWRYFKFREFAWAAICYRVYLIRATEESGKLSKRGIMLILCAMGLTFELARNARLGYCWGMFLRLQVSNLDTYPPVCIIPWEKI